MTACAEIDLAALRRSRSKPAMNNLLARQRLELFAPVYGGTPVHPANSLLAHGAVVVPGRDHFINVQREVIAALKERGVI